MHISHPTREELDEILRLAFRHLPEQELSARLASVFDQIDSETMTLDGIFQARENGRLVGVLFSQLRVDGTVLAWAPTMRDGFSAVPLFENLENYCIRCKAPAALVLADFQQDPDEPALFTQGNFEYLSDLVYMIASVPRDEPAKSEGNLQFVPMNHDDAASERLVKLVRETYRNSKDFPRLMSIVPVDKVLQGYRDSAPFFPELWFFIRENNRDVGVLLMSDMQGDQIELTYMGLIEDARRRGSARKIVQFARQTARLRNRSILLTSVDEQNIAALKSYLAQGFRAWDRKKVYARFF